MLHIFVINLRMQPHFIVMFFKTFPTIKKGPILSKIGSPNLEQRFGTPQDSNPKVKVHLWVLGSSFLHSHTPPLHKACVFSLTPHLGLLVAHFDPCHALILVTSPRLRSLWTINVQKKTFKKVTVELHIVFQEHKMNFVFILTLPYDF